MKLDASCIDKAKEICCNLDVWGILVTVILQVISHLSSFLKCFLFILGCTLFCLSPSHYNPLSFDQLNEPFLHCQKYTCHHITSKD